MRLLQTKYLKWSSYYNSKLLWHFRYKFFDANFFIFENVINATVDDLSNTGILLLVNKTYTMENKDLCGNKPGYLGYLTQKTWFICLLLRVTWLVLFEGFEWVKPCKFAIVVSISQKTKTKKTKERHKAEGETKVSGVRWLGEE